MFMSGFNRGLITHRCFAPLQLTKVFRLSESIVLLELPEESVARLLGVSKEHGRVLVEEDGVVHSCVAHTQGALHHHHLQ